MKTNIVIKELNEVNLKEYIKYKNLNIPIPQNISSLLAEKGFYKKLGMEYAIIYNYDFVAYGNLNELSIDLDNITEARFFNEDEEIVIRTDNKGVKGSLFIDKGEKNYFIEEKFYLRSNKAAVNKNYNTLKVKKYIDLDEDNQAYVFYLKPCKLIREA